MSAKTITSPSAPPVTAAAAAPRHDTFHAIHKALRLFMGDTLARLGRTDPTDADDVCATLAQLADLLGLCETHLEHENAFIHPALERVRPGSAADAAAEHERHREAIADLRDLAGLIGDTRDAVRAAALGRLYRAFALFVAENLGHMHEEETEHNAVLWSHYSDAELHEIEAALKAHVAPEAMRLALHWMLPALSAPERAGLLGVMRSAMPPAAFEGVLDLARQRLPAGELAKLGRALGIDPVPGLVRS